MELSVAGSVPTRPNVFLGGALRFFGTYRRWHLSLLQEFNGVAGETQQTTVFFSQTSLLLGLPHWRLAPSWHLAGDLGPTFDLYRVSRTERQFTTFRFGGQLGLALLWRWNNRLAMTWRLSLQLSPQAYAFDVLGSPNIEIPYWRATLQWGIRWKWF